MKIAARIALIRYPRSISSAKSLQQRKVDQAKLLMQVSKTFLN